MGKKGSKLSLENADSNSKIPINTVDVPSSSRDIITGDRISSDIAVKLESNPGTINIYPHDPHPELVPAAVNTDNLDEEFKQALLADARKKSVIENFVSDKVARFADLELTDKVERNIEEHDLRFYSIREESKLESARPPVGLVNIDKLFSKAKALAEYEVTLKIVDNQEAKNDFIELKSNIVGIFGQAGCGKTTLSKKILGMVIGPRKLFNIKYVFYFEFCEINVYNQPTTFLKFLCSSIPVDILNDQQKQLLILKQLEKSENILIILDGLDQANLDFSQNNSKFSIDSKATAVEFIKNLLCGNILPNAKKLVFSRPRQLLELDHNYRPLYLVNILGLKRSGQKQICEDICNGNTESVYHYINDHPVISAYCQTPLNLILTAYAVNEFMSQNLKNFSHSLTSILATVLNLFVKSVHLHGSLETEKIARLAWQGFKNQSTGFQSEELGKERLSNDSIDNLFETVIEKPRLKLLRSTSNRTYTFSHQILQEFFVALYLLFFLPLEEFQELFFSNTLDKQFDLTSNRFEMVTNFMFGLCNSNNYALFQSIIPPFPILKEKKSLLQSLVLTETISNMDNDALLCFGWAYELDDDKFTRTVARCLNDEIFLSCQMLPKDFTAIDYVCKFRDHPVTLAQLTMKNFYGDYYTRFFSDPKFKNPLIKIKVLNISGIEISNDALQNLIDFLYKVQALYLCYCYLDFARIFYKIKQLDNKMKVLAISGLKFYGGILKRLCDCIHNVQNLHINQCFFPDGIFPNDIFIQVKSLNEKLEMLDISGNEIVDTSDLCSCLYNVESLDISDCSLSSQSVAEVLWEIRTSPIKMKSLNLSGNEISDETAKTLAVCLRNINNLCIRYCSLSKIGIMHIFYSILNRDEMMESLDITYKKGVLSEEEASNFQTDLQKKVKKLTMKESVEPEKLDFETYSRLNKIRIKKKPLIA